LVVIVEEARIEVVGILEKGPEEIRLVVIE